VIGARYLSRFTSAAMMSIRVGVLVRSTSRALSVLLVLAALWRAWPESLLIWYVVIIGGPGLVVIWFPELIDELFFGTWHHGYRIDSHTPAVLIAAVGWVLLLINLSIVFDPALISRLFGMTD
jgi:uncharacterized membrane protein YoaT (DUF817 family)